MSSSSLTATRGLLTAAETAGACNFMKAFTVHATNSAQRSWPTTRTLHTDMPCRIYAPCKCTLVRDARRATRLRSSLSSIFYFTPVRRPKSARKNSLRFLLSQRDGDNRVSFLVSHIVLHVVPPSLSPIFFPLFLPWLSYLLNARPFGITTVLQIIRDFSARTKNSRYRISAV